MPALCRILFGITLVFSISSQAEYKWGFADLSVNYLDWDKGTQDKSTKKDFTFIELEGGAEHSWGDVYGFYDVENVGQTGDDMRTAAKGVLRYNLGDSGLSAYLHVYNFTSAGFAEQNRVTGLGYQWKGEGWWFKPFLGVHEVSQTFFNGFNGYMAGWVFGYNFTGLGQNFMAASWHEYEFARKSAYASGNGDKTTGQNGAASIWWNSAASFSLGLQYRYATDKLGTGGEMSALITSLRYNL